MILVNMYVRTHTQLNSSVAAAWILYLILNQT